jgi:8-amino-7-oxononanoate synthase
LRDFLVNRCRPFIFATAPSPLLAACVREALRIVEGADDRRVALAARVALAGRDLRAALGLESSGTQIQPVVVGSNARALALAAAMRAYGYDIRAIRPPTVPEGAARLRLALTLHTSEEDIATMIGRLAQELARLEA